VTVHHLQELPVTLKNCSAIIWDSNIKAKLAISFWRVFFSPSAGTAPQSLTGNVQCQQKQLHQLRNSLSAGKEHFLTFVNLSFLMLLSA
jgi:hypothetical protein